MAYKLSNIATFGTLQLHIWSADLRQESPRGPKIHDHAWHIDSLVTHGTYTDVIYDVEEQPQLVYSEEEWRSQGLLRVFSPRFSDTSAALQTDGTCAIVTPENRTFESGSARTIPVGVFHITDISPWQPCGNPLDRITNLQYSYPHFDGYTHGPP